ncbi:MAG: class I SAM-dependent methyltransferase [Acidobacteriota bacterium]|nr:class I SAM-dependent methyltransferase [Acidobacteriota bacterium]
MNRLFRTIRHGLRSRRQFYSPIVNPYDDRVQRILKQHATSELSDQEDIQIDVVALKEMFFEIASAYPDLPFSDQPEQGFRYHYKNPSFSYGDAITLFGMMRHFKPKRIVEVGSGYSSCLLMDTNDRFFDGSINLTFIDPYPQALKRLLREDDKYQSHLRCEALQDVPTALFRELSGNDILFIDSSHVAKTGSDVNDYLFRILPALHPGVIVHIHDIPYPFEYPPDWILKDERSWNEVYVLRAFLQYNSSFKIIYFNHLMYRRFADLLEEHMPLCLKNCGASIWLKKTSAPGPVGF